jgi:hypothetical protein
MKGNDKKLMQTIREQLSWKRDLFIFDHHPMFRS